MVILGDPWGFVSSLKQELNRTVVAGFLRRMADGKIALTKPSRFKSCLNRINGHRLSISPVE